MKLQTKLISAFSLLAIITLVVSLIGYWEAKNLASALYEVGAVRLPSIQGLDMINEGMTFIKSSEQTMLVQGIDDAAIAEQLEQRKKAWKRVDKGWNLYEPLPQSTEEAAKWKLFVPAWKIWKHDDEKLIALIIESRDTKQPKLLVEAQKYRKVSTEVLAKNAEILLAEITAINDEIATEAKLRSVASSEDMIRVQNVMIVSALIGVISAFLLGFFMGRMFSKPLVQMGNALTKIAGGDFTINVPVESHDEIGKMAEAMNSMVDALRTSESRLRMLGDNLPNGMVYQVIREFSGTMNFLYISAGVKRLNGVTASAVLNDSSVLYDQIIKEDRSMVATAEDASAKTMSVFSVNARICRSDGQIRWMNFSSTPRSLPDGRIIWDGIETDITESKKTEQALYANEDLLRQFIKHTPAAVAMFDTSMRYLQASDRWMSDYHLEEREIIGKSHYEIFPDVPERWKEIHRRVLAGAVERCDDDPFPRADGSMEWLQWEVRPWYSVEGAIGGLTMFTQVITGRKQIEEALRFSEERFRSAMQSSPIGMGIVSTEGQWLEVNPALCRIVGYSHEELCSRNFQSITHPDDLAADLNAVRQLLAKEVETINYEKRYIHQNGNIVWIQLNATLVMNPNNTPRHFVAQIQDITARKQAEQSIRDNRAKLVLTMDMAKLAPWELDYTTGMFTFNENFYALYKTTAEREGGFVMSAETYARKFIPEESLAVVEEEIQKAVTTTDPGYTRQFEHHMLRADGTKGVVLIRFSIVKDEHGKTIRAHGATQDISERIKREEERNKLEAQLFQSQRIESIGTLAAGIAHDFNNILNAIMGHTSLLMSRLSNPEKLSRSIDAIQSSSERGVGLVRQMLTYARKTKTVLKPININDVLTEIINLLKETFPKTITVSMNLQPTLPMINGDVSQLYQVILNLCINARDSMSSGGNLTISSTVVSKETIRMYSRKTNARQYVRVIVEDTGSGIDEKVQGRIFEPFFTTKEPGSGTGLGLAVSYSIVENHHGVITFTSTPDIGTSFLLYFPIEDHMMIDEELLELNGTEKLGGTETILVIEDEEYVRELFEEALEPKGYTLLFASDGEEGVTTFKNNKGSIAVVISDLGLPKMRGDEAFRQMKAINPSLKIIFASGYIDTTLKNDLEAQGVRYFIQKPYSQELILQTIRAVIDEEPLANT